MKRRWREGLLVATGVGTLAWLFASPPIKQDVAYHDFADGRSFVGIPNFLDVVTNLPFLLVSIAGCLTCLGGRREGAWRSWLVLFSAVGLVSAGSAYYHWHPTNATLVWDRLPMSMSFSALFVALLSEYVDRRLESWLLMPAVLLGLLSVVAWHVTADLRLYYWVQGFPLLGVLLILALFKGRFSHSAYLAIALGLYVLAKVLEFNDDIIFTLTGNGISGHSFKHLAAAGSLLYLQQMLRLRTQCRED